MDMGRQASTCLPTVTNLPNWLRVPKDDKANNWFVGHPIDCIYDYEKVGLWNSDDPDFQYLDILEPGGNEMV